MASAAITTLTTHDPSAVPVTVLPTVAPDMEQNAELPVCRAIEIAPVEALVGVKAGVVVPTVIDAGNVDTLMMGVALFTTSEVNVEIVVAAFQLVSPACAAVMVQVPAVTGEIEFPVMVHIAGVELA